jgi:hypothetical protein
MNYLISAFHPPFSEMSFDMREKFCKLFFAVGTFLIIAGCGCGCHPIHPVDRRIGWAMVSRVLSEMVFDVREKICKLFFAVGTSLLLAGCRCGCHPIHPVDRRIGWVLLKPAIECR